MSNLGPRSDLVGFVRVSQARFCIYSTRKTMGAIGRSRWLLEVIHRKAFTLTVGSFSRVQNAWYEPKPQCMMKFLTSTIEFQWNIFSSQHNGNLQHNGKFSSQCFQWNLSVASSTLPSPEAQPAPRVHSSYSCSTGFVAPTHVHLHLKDIFFI